MTSIAGAVRVWSRCSVAVVVCAFAGACRTFDLSHVALRNSVQPPLPALELTIDDESVLQALGYVEDEVDQPGAPIDEMRRPARVHYTELVREDASFSAREFLEQAHELIRRDLPKALSGGAAVGSWGGSVEVRFTHRKEHTSLVTPFLVPTVLTLGTSLLLGFPAGMQSATVRVAIAFRDRGGKEVGVYEGEGSTTQFAALYWGWSVWGPNFRAASDSSGTGSHQYALAQAVVAVAVAHALDAAVAGVAADSARLSAALQ